MDMNRSAFARLIAGAGGVLLIVSLFLPWADVEGVSRSGWELWTMADVLFLIVGAVAVGAAITGGRFGLFRPDLSLNGATDILGVVATILIGWLLIFDFSEGASREIGAFLALIAAAAVAGGAGDYRVAARRVAVPEDDLGGRSATEVKGGPKLTAAAHVAATAGESLR